MAKCDAGSEVDAAFIRTTMMQGAGHFSNEGFVWNSPVKIHDTADTAHMFSAAIGSQGQSVSLEEELKTEHCDFALPWLTALQIESISEDIIKAWPRRHRTRIAAFFHYRLHSLVVV